MNREIKFRTFLLEEKQMVYSDGDDTYISYFSPQDREIMVYPHHSHYSYDDRENRLMKYNCVLMQYTGLKDCKGKDIYEGDILRNNCVLLQPVEYTDECFKVNGLSLCWYLQNTSLEIVSNSFEIPGSLK